MVVLVLEEVHQSDVLCVLEEVHQSDVLCVLEGGLSLEEALEVQQILREGVDLPGEGGAGLGSTALELLQQEERSIVTFCSSLDAALGGGVPVGKTTELCGTPGMGKTQLW